MTLLTQDVPRYRVSKQRQSERARVLEFIVITDTHAKPVPLRQLLGTALPLRRARWCRYFRQ